ncbi:DNA mismatch repair protein MutT [Kitasatospora griseola]|uniref:DNA mismatch repair protein MutT n=1 Tax=Kitasatospora griseola TaxID=2064 RepID=A0A0D0N996_KITGR|nr:NUDIX domain-containing protein [Kitasatospora griseola]KIQ64775.1 DNA mismatch repair protein MutT [Kitasatospora griseola]
MTVTSPEFVADLAADAEAAGISGFVAAAVIRHDGRVLFVRRNPDDYMGGRWEIPSGTVEDGESILEALYRETAEETGLTIGEVVDYLGHFDYSNSRGTLTRQFNFSVTVEKAEPVILTEHDAHEWALPTEPPAVTDSLGRIIGAIPQAQTDH